MAKRLLRKTLSAPGLLRAVRKSFDKVPDPVPRRKFTLSDCLMSGAGGVRAEVPVAAPVRPRCAHRRDGAGESEDSVRGRARAVRHGAARAARRGGPAGAARCVQARVRAAPARQGAGGVHLSRRALSALGRRDGVLLLVERALRQLLQEASQGRTHHVLPPDAGRGGGASRAARGLRACARAHREGRRGDEERLRAQRGEAAAGRCAPRASASEAHRGRGRARLERAAHQAAEIARHALHPRGEAGRPHRAVRVGGGHRADEHRRGEVRRAHRRPRRASSVPIPQRCAAQRHALRAGGELPRILGDPPRRQEATLLLGHRPAHQ